MTSSDTKELAVHQTLVIARGHPSQGWYLTNAHPHGIERQCSQQHSRDAKSAKLSASILWPVSGRANGAVSGPHCTLSSQHARPRFAGRPNRVGVRHMSLQPLFAAPDLPATGEVQPQQRSAPRCGHINQWYSRQLGERMDPLAARAAALAFGGPPYSIRWTKNCLPRLHCAPSSTC